MARYDGLIIPRSYSEYINKTDAATHQQAHQVSGVLDAAPTENSNKAVKSGGVYTALAGKQPTLTFDDVPTDDSDNPVKSGGVYSAMGGKKYKIIKDTYTITSGYVTVNPEMQDNNYFVLCSVLYGGSVNLGIIATAQIYTKNILYIYLRNADGTLPADNSTVVLSILILY